MRCFRTYRVSLLSEAQALYAALRAQSIGVVLQRTPLAIRTVATPEQLKAAWATVLAGHQNSGAQRNSGPNQATTRNRWGKWTKKEARDWLDLHNERKAKNGRGIFQERHLAQLEKVAGPKAAKKGPRRRKAVPRIEQGPKEYDKAIADNLARIAEIEAKLRAI